jgi:hypothetical protein
MQTKHVVLERLKKLVEKGYVIRWGESDEDTLHLVHPRAPDLTLFSDGRVWVLTLSPDDWIAPDDEADQGRFQSFMSPNDWIAAENEADQRRFKSFVARVPKPTTLQAFKAKAVADLWKKATVWTVIIVMTFVVVFISHWLWRLVVG